MKHELTTVIDKIEHLKCKSHSKTAEIKLEDGMIKIDSCCKEHKKFLERKIDYEMYMLLNISDEEVETLSALKQAV